MWEETRPLPSLHLTPVNVVPTVVMSSTVYSPLLSNCRPSLPSQRVSFNLFYTTNRVTGTRYLPFFHFQNDLSYTRPLSVKLFATKFDSDRPTHAEEENQDPSPSLPSSNKVSFAVATGELFLGIASRLIGRRRKNLSSNSIMNSTTKDDPILFVLGNQSNSEPIKTLDIDNYAERIATVEDSQSEVLWEQRVKDVEAEDQRKKMIATTSPGFSFSAAGLLFPYHLGVARFLIENGYINETTPLAGSSAGAIICATIASGASMEEALNATKTLAHDCRTNGTAFRLGTVLRDILNTFLPDDVHIRSNGRVRVAITQLLWRPRGLLVDQFDSKEDLINAIITSSFIPGYLAPRPATMFRNRVCIDGGLTLFMPPTSADQTVRVCAFPATQLGLKEIGISPDCNPEDRPTSRQLFNWALEPAEDYILDKLFEFGYSDAAVWAYNNPITDNTSSR